MARDGSGNYTLPAGNPIPFRQKPAQSAGMNATLADIATALQDSLSRSGKGAMLANLAMGGFALVGLGLATAATPAVSFAGATTTGLYAPGAGQIGIAVGGVAAYTINGNRQHTMAAPVSGATLTVSAVSGGTAAAITDATRAFAVDFSGDAVKFGGTSAHNVNILAGNATAGVVTPAGNWTLNAASAGDTLTVSGRARVVTSLAVGGTLQFSGVLEAYAPGSAAFSSVMRYSNDVSGPAFALVKSRGASESARTIVNSGDGLGDFYFQGTDGATNVIAARIRSAVDGAPALGSVPGNLTLSTTPVGGTLLTRVTVSANGTLTISAPSNSASSLVVNGSTAQSVALIGAAGQSNYLRIGADAGQIKGLALSSGSSWRWLIAAENTAEGGANAGSNFSLQRMDDAGNFLATVLTIVRATGATTLSGDLAFSGTARRITGDFNNATLASRTIFQSASAGATVVAAMPNGGGSFGGFTAYDGPDPDNAAAFGYIASTAAIINSQKAGTGVTKPISIRIDNTEAVNIGLNRNVSIAAPVSGNALNVAGSVALTSSAAASFGISVTNSDATGSSNASVSLSHGSGHTIGISCVSSGSVVRATAASGFYIGNSANGALLLETNGLQRVSIAASGGVTLNSQANIALYANAGTGTGDAIVIAGRPADNLGKIRFVNSANTVEHLKIETAGESSIYNATAANLNFGIGNATQFRIDAAGRWMNHANTQPAFYATDSGASQTSGTTTTFPIEVLDQGGNFDSSTGVFTAPVTGLYHFFAQVQVQTTAGDTFPLFFSVNDSVSSSGDFITATLASGNFGVRIGQVFLRLTAGQTVRVKYAAGYSATATAFRRYFGGYLLG